MELLVVEVQWPNRRNSGSDDRRNSSSDEHRRIGLAAHGTAAAKSMSPTTILLELVTEPSE